MSARLGGTVFPPLDSGQGGEGDPGLFLAHFGEMEVNHGGLEGGVAEVGGDLAHAGACLQHVGGVAVAQGVDAHFFMVFHEAALEARDFHGELDAGGTHGLAAFVEGLLKGEVRAFPATPGCGEEPVGVAVPLPELAQPHDEGGTQRDFARLAAFGVSDPQDVAAAVDVLGADVEGLAHAQAAVIDKGEVGFVTVVPKGAQELGDFLAGEDVGQRLLAADPDLAPDLPGFSEVVAVEGAQGADGLVEGGTGELALGLEVEEEIENLTRCEGRELLSGEVVGELGDPAEIGFNGASAQPFELDEGAVVFIPSGGCECVVFFS